MKKAIAVILENRSGNTQLSPLGKLDDSYSEDSRSALNHKKNVKHHWRQLLGEKADFGLFSNPDVGTIFTVDPLVGTFLHDVEGTKLAELSAEPYGILQGLGVTSKEAGGHIQILVNGGFLLIVRGYDQDLKKLDNELISL